MENRDLFRGGVDICTKGVLKAQGEALEALLLDFSVSLKVKDSKFSPTKDGVLEQTDEPVETVVEALVTLTSSSKSSKKSSLSLT